MKNRSFFRVGQVLAATVLLSLNAHPQPASDTANADTTAEPAAPADPSSEVVNAPAERPMVPSADSPVLIPVPVDPATVVLEERPEHIPSVIWSYRSLVDANPVIGKPFQPGSADFV